MTDTKTKPRGSGKLVGYFVEARVPKDRIRWGEPPKVGSTYITETWRRIGYDQRHPTIGVKNEMHNALAEQHGVLSFAAAKALMAWSASWHPCVEFRLVKVEFRYEYEITEKGVGPVEYYGYAAGRDVEFTDR